MRVYPNIFLVIWTIISLILLLGLFAGSLYISVVVTTDNNATTFLKFAIYLFTIILGTTLYVIKKSFSGKFLFIKKLATGDFKVTDPWTMTSEMIHKRQIRGFSTSSRESARRFVRLYFDSRDSITLLSYYSNFGQIERELRTEKIEFLGQEKFNRDIWGRPTGQKF